MTTFNDKDSLMIESEIDPDEYVSPIDDNSDFSENDIYIDSLVKKSCSACKFFIDDCCDHLDIPDAYVPKYIKYSGCGLFINGEKEIISLAVEFLKLLETIKLGKE